MGWSACLQAGDLKEQGRMGAGGGGQMVITEVSLGSGKGIFLMGWVSKTTT